ncbi:MAG: prepilin-type N-terminal cleavage/methylation domain-containing protein [Minisyncoccia bacterium]
MHKIFNQKGITIVEILIVIAIIGIISVIVFPQFSKTKENQVFKNAVGDILSSLNKTHSQTLASLDSSEYGIHFQSDKIIIFKGTVYSGIDPNNEIVNIISPANISNINLSGGGSEIYFNRLSGIPNKTGDITVSVPSVSKIITISATGAFGVN